MNDTSFYVYQYLSENGLPYYVGKGKGYRMHCKHTSTLVPPRNRRKIIKNSMTEEEALALEKTLIEKYGRKKDGGILDNIKIDCWVSHTGWNHTPAAKAKISIGNTGKIRSLEAKENYRKYASNRPAEVNEKIRKARIGAPSRTAGKILATKGKTWEEIYGVDAAKKRREDAKFRRLNRKNESKEVV